MPRVSISVDHALGKGPTYNKFAPVPPPAPPPPPRPPTHIINQALAKLILIDLDLRHSVTEVEPLVTIKNQAQVQKGGNTSLTVH